jgi:hypothetical protein
MARPASRAGRATRVPLTLSQCDDATRPTSFAGRARRLLPEIPHRNACPKSQLLSRSGATAGDRVVLAGPGPCLPPHSPRRRVRLPRPKRGRQDDVDPRLGPPFISAFRPEEAISVQVLAAAVAAIDRRRPEGVVVAGDMIDNARPKGGDRSALDPPRRPRRKLGRAGLRGRTGRLEPGSFSERRPPRHARQLEGTEQPFRSPGLDAP